MTRAAFVHSVAFLALAIGPACVDTAPDDNAGIPVVRIASSQDLSVTRLEAARAFFETHPDTYDQIVFWDTNNLLNGQFSYTPVANDTLGLGYANMPRGEDMFDDAADYGSERLEGVIWMGTRWRTIDIAGSPASVVGLLAEETGHRWGSRVRYIDGNGALSDRLLAPEHQHWSSLLNAGNSPLGGRAWQSVGNDTFELGPRGDASYCDFDLYLMGLVSAADVQPLQLLIDVESGDCVEPQPCAEAWRDVPPDVVEATVESVSIGQIIAAEGERSPGSTAAQLRQAWVYVIYDDDDVRASDLERLELMRAAWHDHYATATRGLGSVQTR